MTNVTRVQKGGVVPVRLPFREIRSDHLDGQRIQPNGATVTVLNPDESIQVFVPSLTWEQTGVMLFYWDTSALALGVYKARVRFGYAFSSGQGGVTKIGEKDFNIRLVKSL